MILFHLTCIRRAHTISRTRLRLPFPFPFPFHFKILHTRRRRNLLWLLKVIKSLPLQLRLISARGCLEPFYSRDARFSYFKPPDFPLNGKVAMASSAAVVPSSNGSSSNGGISGGKSAISGNKAQLKATASTKAVDSGMGQGAGPADLSYK